MLPQQHALLLLLLLLVPLSPVTARAGALRLCSWNIRNYSKTGRSDAERSIIATLLLRCDFIAVQEVRTEEPGAAEAVATLAADLGTYYAYVVSDPIAPTQERYAFFYRTSRLTLKSSPAPFLYADSGDKFIREPFCAAFSSTSSSREFIVCTIHVLFGTVAERRVELESLDAVWATMTAAVGASTVRLLCGDFNMPPSDSSFYNLKNAEAGGVVALVDAPWRTTVGAVSLYDNFWTRGSNDLELFLSNATNVVAFDELMFPPAINDDMIDIARQSISDHRLVEVQLLDSGELEAVMPLPTLPPRTRSFSIGSFSLTAQVSRSITHHAWLALLMLQASFWTLFDATTTDVTAAAAIVAGDFDLSASYQHSAPFVFDATLVTIDVAVTTTILSANIQDAKCGQFSSGNLSFAACALAESTSSAAAAALAPTLNSLPLFLFASSSSSLGSAMAAASATWSGGDFVWWPASLSSVLSSTLLAHDWRQWWFLNDMTSTSILNQLSTSLPETVVVVNGNASIVSISTHQCSLFISEYVDGVGHSSALELYNPTDSIIFLSSYHLYKLVNGGTWEEDAVKYELGVEGASVAAHSTYVIVDSQATDVALLAKANLLSPALLITGNDALALVCGAKFVDVVGEATTTPPANGWEVAGVTEATHLHRLRRRSHIVEGNSEWQESAGEDAVASEWEVSGEVPTFDTLGEHVVAPLAASSSLCCLLLSAYVEGDGYEKAVAISNPSLVPVRLDDYELLLLVNGKVNETFASDAKRLALGIGVLDSGATLIVAHTDTTASSLPPTMLSNTRRRDSYFQFNGDDALALMCKGEVIDRIGDEGEAPTSPAAYAIGLVDDATRQHTLQRRDSIMFGYSLAKEVQWDAVKADEEWVVASWPSPLVPRSTAPAALFACYWNGSAPDDFRCCELNVHCPSSMYCNISTGYCDGEYVDESPTAAPSPPPPPSPSPPSPPPPAAADAVPDDGNAFASIFNQPIYLVIFILALIILIVLLVSVVVVLVRRRRRQRHHARLSHHPPPLRRRTLSSSSSSSLRPPSHTFSMNDYELDSISGGGRIVDGQQYAPAPSFGHFSNASSSSPSSPPPPPPSLVPPPSLSPPRRRSTSSAVQGGGRRGSAPPKPKPPPPKPPPPTMSKYLIQ